jgi:hypothetical protein
MLLMDVGAEKSWSSFNISEGKQLAKMIGRCITAGLITFLLLVLPGKHEGVFNPSGAILVPFITLFFYACHILFNKKHRESWKEYLKIDRWNLITLAGCVVVAFCAATLS